MHPFIARFRWLIARMVGFPPFRDDGGGSFRVLYVSNMLRKRNDARSMGTRRGMIVEVRWSQLEVFDVFDSAEEQRAKQIGWGHISARSHTLYA